MAGHQTCFAAVLTESLNAVQAASDRFDIKVKGKGGHGAAPHSTVDAIVEASHLVLALQTIVSRNRDPLEPAVLSVCMMKGGHGYNIICAYCRSAFDASLAALKMPHVDTGAEAPIYFHVFSHAPNPRVPLPAGDEVALCGTVRTFSEDTRSMVIRRMREVCDGVAATFGGSVDFIFDAGYPATVNRCPASVACVKKCGEELVGLDRSGVPFTTCGAEDFSYFLQEKVRCCHCDVAAGVEPSPWGPAWSRHGVHQLARFGDFPTVMPARHRCDGCCQRARAVSAARCCWIPSLSALAARCLLLCRRGSSGRGAAAPQVRVRLRQRRHAGLGQHVPPDC